MMKPPSAIVPIEFGASGPPPMTNRCLEGPNTSVFGPKRGAQVEAEADHVAFQHGISPWSSRGSSSEG